MTADDNLLTAADLAERLGHVTEDWVKRRTKTDDWPHVRFSGKTIRYRPEHVAQIVALYDQAGKLTTGGLDGQTAGSRSRA